MPPKYFLPLPNEVSVLEKRTRLTSISKSDTYNLACHYFLSVDSTPARPCLSHYPAPRKEYYVAV